MHSPLKYRQVDGDSQTCRLRSSKPLEPDCGCRFLSRSALGWFSLPRWANAYTDVLRWSRTRGCEATIVLLEGYFLVAPLSKPIRVKKVRIERASQSRKQQPFKKNIYNLLLYVSESPFILLLVLDQVRHSNDLLERLRSFLYLAC